VQHVNISAGPDDYSLSDQLSAASIIITLRTLQPSGSHCAFGAHAISRERRNTWSRKTVISLASPA